MFKLKSVNNEKVSTKLSISYGPPITFEVVEYLDGYRKPFRRQYFKKGQSLFELCMTESGVFLGFYLIGFENINENFVLAATQKKHGVPLFDVSPQTRFDDIEMKTSICFVEDKLEILIGNTAPQKSAMLEVILDKCSLYYQNEEFVGVFVPNLSKEQLETISSCRFDKDKQEYFDPETGKIKIIER